MKRIKLIFSIFTALIALSCSESYLDKQPLDTINTENYPRTAAELITIVNGAYQPLQWPKLYNLRMWTSDIMAGNSIVGAGGGTDGIGFMAWSMARYFNEQYRFGNSSYT